MVKIEFKTGKFILSDSKQWILGKQITTNGDTVINPYGYYSNMASLIKALFDEELRESTATTIEELYSDYKITKHKIMEFFKHLK